MEIPLIERREFVRAGAVIGKTESAQLQKHHFLRQQFEQEPPLRQVLPNVSGLRGFRRQGVHDLRALRVFARRRAQATEESRASDQRGNYFQDFEVQHGGVHELQADQNVLPLVLPGECVCPGVKWRRRGEDGGQAKLIFAGGQVQASVLG